MASSLNCTAERSFTLSKEDLMDITGRQRMVVHFLLSHLLLHKQPGRVRNVQLKQELDAPGFIEEGVKVAARALFHSSLGHAVGAIKQPVN